MVQMTNGIQLREREYSYCSSQSSSDDEGCAENPALTPVIQCEAWYSVIVTVSALKPEGRQTDKGIV